MKTKKILTSLAIIAFLWMILPGCLDVYLTTTINNDGTLNKTIVFEGDSTEIINNTMFNFIDQTWDTAWYVVDKDKRKLVVDRKFKNTRELNDVLNPADSTKIQIRSEAKLKRKFRWFFTYNDYTETMISANCFNRINWKDYLTDSEVRLLTLDEDSIEKDSEYNKETFDITEKRFEDFLTRSIFEDFFHLLVTIPEPEQSIGMSAEDMNKSKEHLFQWLVDSGDYGDLDRLMEQTGVFYNKPVFNTLSVLLESHFKNLADKINFFEQSWDDTYKLAIRMPGIILQTEGQELEGNVSRWELGFVNFYFKDYTMHVESRTVNTWAFIIAGIILIISLFTLGWTLIKKK